MERFEGKQGGESHLFAVNKTSIFRQPCQNKLQITPRNWKISLPTSLSVSQPFQIETIGDKNQTFELMGIAVSWTYGLGELVSKHKQLYLHPATEDRPHPTLAKKNIILYLLVFLWSMCAVLLLNIPINLFSCLSITMPKNPAPQLLLILGGRETSQQVAWYNISIAFLCSDNHLFFPLLSCN